jgi:ABC-type glycerol-3-phosphate transport system substrate-binding protein
MKTDRTAIAARRFSRRTLLRAAAVSAALPAVAHAQKATKITVWTWGGTERFQRRVDAFKRLFPDVAARIEVDVVSPGKQDGEVYQAFRLALASGNNVPDMVQMNYIGMPEFAEAGVLGDLGGMMKPYAGDLVDGARQLAAYNGTTIAIPYQMKGKVWFYRKDLFEQAGIDPAAVRTFDDYMVAGRRFHEKHPKSYIMNIGRTPIHYWYFMILSNWPETRVADRDGKFRILADAHFATLIDWLKTWRGSGIAFDTDDFSPAWQPAFADSSICGSPISNWMTDFLPKFAPEQGGRWGITLWPEFNRRGSEAGGGVMTIPEQSRNKEAAFEFASRMFLTASGSVDEWERTGNPTVLRSAQQEMLDRNASMTRPAGLTDAQWTVMPNNYFGRDFLRPILDSFDQFNVFPYDPAALAELDIMRRETEAYIGGSKTREQTLQAMAASMTAQIGNPYKT